MKTLDVASPEMLWDVNAREAQGAGPSYQAGIDAEFTEVMRPYMDSEGWVCSLTIECGTVVCACQ